MTVSINGSTGITTPAIDLTTPLSVADGGTGTTRAYTLESGTAINTTSGTSHDFTGIPSWAKRITLMPSGVSTNGTSLPIVQLGDSGGIENTGYVGTSAGANTGNVLTATSFTTGFGLCALGAATNTLSGSIVLTLTDSATNTWTSFGSFGNTGSFNGGFFTGGHKPLSGTLDRIRLTTVNGTDTFDAGSINIMWEG